MGNRHSPFFGASTLSTQVVGNLFLRQADSRTTAALPKGLPLPLALMIDCSWSKRRLVEIYLNIAEWVGDDELGVASGARGAFRRPARRLAPREAALLVAMLPNPRDRDASDPTSRMARVVTIIEWWARMVDVGCLAFSRDR